MALLEFFMWLNDSVFAVPATILFLSVGIFLTIKTNVIQFRGIFPLISFLKRDLKHKEAVDETDKKTINSFQALFTAMSSTIGMGNIVSPTIAIFIGGPGALFWLIAYSFFGGVTKFVEVCFAMHTRKKMSNGRIVGGPMEYLKLVSPYIALWYTVVTVFVFAVWSGLQANVLAEVFEQEGIPHWATGAFLAGLILLVLQGGAQRVGQIASKLVPIMFFFYLSFALLILFRDIPALMNAIRLVMCTAFSPSAAMGGFVGASLFKVIHAGMYKGILITEGGLGTSSIAHAIADTKKPTDQGLLAMYSILADSLLSLVSGLLVLVTGVWLRGSFRTTLVYEVFKMNSPVLGRFVLLVSIALFVITTVIGNSFSGTQSFASLTKNRWSSFYIIALALITFVSALMPVPLIWEITDTLLTLIAIPNLIGLAILVIKKPEVIQIRD